MAYPVSDQFLRAATASHRVATRVDVTVGGVAVATDVQITAGSVRVSRSAAVRRACSVTVVGLPRDLVPTSRNRSPLAPYGAELVISSGIRYPGGAIELLPQGIFGITRSNVVDTADGIAVQLEGADRADRIAKAHVIRPWATAAGTTAVTAISNLAADRFPGIEVVDLASSADTYPVHLLEEQANPWEEGIEHFAAAAGAEAFMDRSGRLLVQDVPEFAAIPTAWQFVEGADCAVVQLGRELDDSAPNAVVVENDTFDAAPVWAVAVDTDPESPTYYGPDVDNPVAGGYGPRPVWESSPLVTSTAQAQAMADARGRVLFGATEKVSVRIVPNGAVDEGDVVLVRRERSGFDDVMVVDGFSFPLVHQGAMDLECWVRRSLA